MTQEELLNKLEIKGNRDVETDTTTVSTDNSNLYSKWYTILDKSDLVYLITEETIMDIDETKLVYLTEDDAYKVTLTGDLDNNVYKLIVEENYN